LIARVRKRQAARLLASLIALAPVQAAAAIDPLAPTGQWTANTAGAASTPPMGWNSWNAFRTEVTEEKVLGAAQALIDTGLADLGYVYVNVDDGWWLKRRQSDGRLQIRTAIFPSARIAGTEETSFRPFVDRIHKMGLKAGLYTDVGRNACSQAYDLHSPNLPEGSTAEREVGLFGHVGQDIRLFFREWGFDYIKVDACGLADFRPGSLILKEQGYRGFGPQIERGMPNRSDEAAVRGHYEAVARALKRENPDGDFIFSITPWGEANVRSWGKNVGNLWRTSGDITPQWSRLLHNFDSTASRALYAQPGAWNDPDMLFVGTGDFDENHLTEAKSHFSLWAIMNAPLLIGYDLRKAPKALLDIWRNADVVAINQDKGGHQGVVAYQSNDLQIIVKTLSDRGGKAVAIFNRGLAPVKATLTAEHLKFNKTTPIGLRDLWTRQTLPAFAGSRDFNVAPRETVLLIAEGQPELANGIYLSEIPGSINVAVDGVLNPEVDPQIHQMVSPWTGTKSQGERVSYAGWGGAQADAAPYGGTLQVAGQGFASGIGILSGSRLEIRNDNFSHFSTSVGINDTSRSTRGAVQFFVYGDRELLAETPPIPFGAAAKPLTADVRGVKIIELVARTVGGDSTPISVTWGSAALGR
jgi:alpha-galactosidase